MHEVEGQMVGHSIYCVYDLLLGHVPVADVQAVYLSASILKRLDESDSATRVRVAGIKLPGYLLDQRAFEFKQAIETAKEKIAKPAPAEPDAALVLYDRVAAMWAQRLIRPRPEEWGPVGKAYWMRNDEPVVMPWGNARHQTSPALI